jgi:hypothetical protein
MMARKFSQPQSFRWRIWAGAIPFLIGLVMVGVRLNRGEALGELLPVIAVFVLLVLLLSQPLRQFSSWVIVDENGVRARKYTGRIIVLSWTDIDYMDSYSGAGPSGEVRVTRIGGEGRHLTLTSHLADFDELIDLIETSAGVTDSEPKMTLGRWLRRVFW